METGYRKLEVYKLAHELAVKVHAMTLTLPNVECGMMNGDWLKPAIIGKV